MRISIWGTFALIVVASTVGCAKHEGEAANGGKPAAKVTVIEPGAEARQQAQEALIAAKPGEVIEFAEGTFDLDMTLSLEDTPGVTIRGRGMDKTILNFASQGAGAGGEGIKVAAGCDNFAIEDLTIRDTKADGIKVQGIDGCTFRRVLVEWTRGPHPDNGAYGVYPVLSKNVLVEHCTVTDCSDAGVYVGQSENVIVRNNIAERNVMGIEIENTTGADVYDNICRGNTGGLGVFTLPGLDKKDGSHCRVYNNEITDNNHENFAKAGNIVASVPSGTGLMIMANDHVEVFNNKIRNNQTSNVSVISFLATGTKYDDPKFDPYPEAVYIHDNEISDGGKNPQGEFGLLLKTVITEMPVPDIIYDGILPPEDRLVDGQLPPEKGIYFKNNGDADFVYLDMVKLQEGDPSGMTRDLSKFEGELPPLSAIVIEGVE
ncbi:MAG: right-handed parallel beta-helix repeat-containing protein [Pirellulales bacterium]|nr:right-handed parallel beta-helix repeat-containing protein [Pirellulales bacterium]